MKAREFPLLMNKSSFTVVHLLNTGTEHQHHLHLSSFTADRPLSANNVQDDTNVKEITEEETKLK